MRVPAAWLLAFGLSLPAVPVASAQSALHPCARSDGTSLRDVHWQQLQQHPLVGQVLAGERPIAIGGGDGACTRTPLQQLIADVWGTIRTGGIVLLGEVHDNPEHHPVRGDILRPRLEPHVRTRGLRPAALFEHIRAGQRAQLDAFHAEAARGGRPGDAADLLSLLEWERSGWPAGTMFRPLFQAALGAGLPILPASAERDRMRGLVRGDRSDATGEELARIEMAGRMPPALVEALGAELEASHCGVVPASAFGAMSLAQRYADAHMAEALVAAARRHGGAFLLAGNGHVRTDRGVPWYVRQMAPDLKVVAVMLIEVEAGKERAAAYLPRAPDGTAATDYALFTPRHVRPDPCEKMRQEKR